VALALGTQLWALPAGASPSSSRPRVSPNGLFTIRFTETSPGHCVVEIAKDGGGTARIPRCVGGAQDFYFVGNDGGSFWVLHAVPKVPRGRRYHQHPERWGKVVVAVRYDRSGKVLGVRRLRTFVRGRDVAKLMDKGLRFGWLAGVSGAVGAPPRMTDAGVVELDTVADKRFRLRF
jgi:hypothetical protein